MIHISRIDHLYSLAFSEISMCKPFGNIKPGLRMISPPLIIVQLTKLRIVRRSYVMFCSFRSFKDDDAKADRLPLYSFSIIAKFKKHLKFTTHVRMVCYFRLVMLMEKLEFTPEHDKHLEFLTKRL